MTESNRSDSEHSEIAVRLATWFDSNFNVDDFFGEVSDMERARERAVRFSIETESGAVFGTCGSCGNHSVCYRVGFPQSDLTLNFTRMCYTCFGNHIVWELGSNRAMRRRVPSPDLLDLLPEPEGTRDLCIHCNQFLLVEGDSGYVSWHANEAVVEFNEEGNVYGRVHRHCFWACRSGSYGCGHAFSLTVRNPNGGTSASRRHVLYDGVLCTECFGEIEDSLRACDNCNAYDFEDESYYSESRNELLCRSCEQENYVECDSCGSDYRESREHRHRCSESEVSGVYYYSYKPKAIFYGRDKYHFGIELEMEAPDESDALSDGVQIIKSRLGERVYLKEDSSINYGFEMVTHPHSLQEFQTNFDWSTLGVLSKVGWRSWETSTCGLHVHVSRTAFERNHNRVNRHQLAFIKFVYDNERPVQALAGRVSGYAKFGDKGRLVTKLEEGIGDGHFSAVNTEPEDTLEIRVFRGSLNPTRVLAGIEFVHAAIEHTRHMKVEPKKKPMAWTKFISYVTANEELYPHLVEKLESVLSVRNPNRNEEE